VEYQIKQSEIGREREKFDNRRSDRAVIVAALSDISERIRHNLKLHLPNKMPASERVIEKFDVEIISILKNCIKFSDRVSGERLAQILRIYGGRNRKKHHGPTGRERLCRSGADRGPSLLSFLQFFAGLTDRTAARNSSRYSRFSKALSDCDNVPTKGEFFARCIFIANSSRDTSLPPNTLSEQTAQSDPAMGRNLNCRSHAMPIFTN
jgi:hypothetical protein